MLYRILLFLLYVGLPCFFLIQMWYSYTTSLGKWILQATLAGLYIFDLFLIGLWPIYCGYFVRYLFVLLFIAVFIKSSFNIEKEFFYKLSVRSVLSSVIYFSFIGFFIYRIFLGLNGSNYANPVELAFPLKEGDFYMAHAGTNEAVNHHCSISAQKYAMDIIQINALGLRANKWSPKALKDFCIFGSALYSPCDGIVVEALDQLEDLEPMVMDAENPVGNYLAIHKNESEIIVILAHLMKGSLQVKQGDVVKRGQLIGRVGNSGHTSEPHLHMHAVLDHTGDFLFKGEGVPITFNHRFLVRNDLVR
ncbi:MAG TPA: M23 family metallopeptidase [Candidatus Rhabdochlamydia sp.]|jgi:Peptidase family M23|nr:M23 family metallopeptidase [Candidatus Rhabdochlamydia sp.]